MSETSTPEPRLSVIVPTCNRAPALALCLAALADQTLPKADMEVLVVDDSGTRGEGTILPVSPRFPRLRLLRHQANSGAGAARNTGARAASAPYLAFTDDDCLPEPTWAAELLAQFLESPGVALAGTVLVYEPQPSTDRVTQLLSTPMKAEDGTILRAQSANLAVPAEEFETIGGYDEGFTGGGYEDYDICLRWRASGRHILAAPGAVVLHKRDTTLRRYWLQHYRYGRGAAHLYGQGPEGPRPPLKSSLGNMVRTIRAGNTLPERLKYTGLVGLSQIAMLAGFAAKRFAAS